MTRAVVVTHTYVCALLRCQMKEHLHWRQDVGSVRVVEMKVLCNDLWRACVLAVRQPTGMHMTDIFKEACGHFIHNGSWEMLGYLATMTMSWALSLWPSLLFSALHPCSVPDLPRRAGSYGCSLTASQMFRGILAGTGASLLGTAHSATLSRSNQGG